MYVQVLFLAFYDKNIIIFYFLDNIIFNYKMLNVFMLKNIILYFYKINLLHLDKSLFGKLLFLSFFYFVEKNQKKTLR